ncbi:hypothetical protein SLS58_008767 [Diplodia intermedia]|uniref:Zn(2)-C6 fungal-type domain-containing protein n=1 Tax=Diplodia intermedia TaxID=856260 RepID=A0ABR3TGI2_9PEZI
MYSRRPHRNSHHGCRECKEKRVKPRCLRCKSKGRKCTYTHLLSEYNPFDPHQQTPRRQPHHAATTPTLTSPQQQPLVCRANRIYAPGSSTGAILSPFDAVLLEEGGAVFHHYVHVVKAIDPAHHASEQMWRWEKAIRAFAPSHDFLYYAVLTFASLHRSVLYQRSIKNNTPSAGDAAARQQSNHLVAIASAYQSRALAAFAPAVASLQHAAQKETKEGMGARHSRDDGGGGGGQNASLTDAVLTCSSIILASSFSFPPAPGEDVIDQARQVLQLFLGTFAVYERAWEMDNKKGGGDEEEREQRENRGRYPSSPSPASSSSSNGDIGSYVLERMRAGEELGDGLPAPEAEASLERVVDAVLLRAATTTTTAPPSSSSPTFLAMLNPTLLYHTSTTPISLSPQPPATTNTTLSTFLPPLTALRLLFRRLAARPCLHTIALRWPASLPASFLAPALAARDPLALVVLAHWARCLAGFGHLWWVRRWGVRVVRAVEREVLGRGGAGRGGAAEAEEKAWRACLEWPVRGLGGGAEVEGEEVEEVEGGEAAWRCHR